MKPIYVYPGTFSPPTFGHLSVVRQAASLFPELIILCSNNPDKNDVWFDPIVCKELWHSYPLPSNVTVMTPAEFKAHSFNLGAIVLIRGLRKPSDFEQEKAVLQLNKEKFGIKKYFYLFGPNKYRFVSSSRVRQDALNLNLRSLSRQVSPLVISALLEKVLEAKNVFLVVGRPGGGKSTLLRLLGESNPNNYWLNTDDFNRQLKPLLAAHFGESDLINVALHHEAEMKKVIAEPWLKLLSTSLRQAPRAANIFIEIAYGLQADKSMFRFIGGKIIYVGCEDEAKNQERIEKRGTPQLASFIQKIPDRDATQLIADKYQLSVSYVNTDCSLTSLKEKASEINHLILGGQKNVYAL